MKQYGFYKLIGIKMQKVRIIKKFLFVIILFFIFFTNIVCAKEIKIVQFSDVHIDTQTPNGKIRKYGNSTNMFQKAIIKVNAINPDIVVFSGDMVNRPSSKDFDVFLNIAKQLKTKFYTVVGNHDVGVGGGLSKETIVNKLNQKCDWLDIKKTYYSVVDGEYIFIFMDGTTDKKITSNGYFETEVLNFLDNTLATNSNKKAIIVQHFPLLEPYPSKSHEIENAKEYFEVLDKHKNIILVLSGHYHATRASVRNDVLHVATPSLIEFPHAFRCLTINDNGAEIFIQSELILDNEQNSRENTTTPYARLKLGMSKDSNFEVVLKK